MKPACICPKIIECYDSANEIFKYATIETLKGAPMKKVCAVGTENYRETIVSILDCLLWMDMQYRYEMQETLKAFSVRDIRTCEIYRFDDFYQMLSYQVFTVVDPNNRGFYTFNDYCDMSLRPLHKEYELFLIDNILIRTDLVQQYFRLPFLLAVQRTVYSWLMKACTAFEFKGSFGVDINWAHASDEKDYYNLFSCRIHVEFDLTERMVNSDGTFTVRFDIKLSLPVDFRKCVPVLKSRFTDHYDFYNHLWAVRQEGINKKLQHNFPSLFCDEEMPFSPEQSYK